MSCVHRWDLIAKETRNAPIGEVEVLTYECSICGEEDIDIKILSYN